MKLHSSIKLMVMDDCNDGLPMYSVDVMVEIRRDEPDLLEDTEYENNIRFPGTISVSLAFK